ncbi:SLATT domain-containing protein [Undibacterium sp. Di26W]|uniref:SLATT domain-containing protein n=1 Tax=Undibacterium sp. Di26W TaxID=3413035 RepID=UPI003BF13556
MEGSQAQTIPTVVTPAHNYRRILLEIELLEHDSFQFQAQRHWQAGRSNLRSWQTANMLVVIINTLVASSALALFKNVWAPAVHDWAIAGLSLIAALLAALMLKFKPDENLQQLKTQGTKFAQIARSARQIAGRLHDGILTLAEAWVELQKLTQDYNKLCEEAQSANVGGDVTTQVLHRSEDARKTILEKIKQCQEENNAA